MNNNIVLHHNKTQTDSYSTTSSNSSTTLNTTPPTDDSFIITTNTRWKTTENDDRTLYNSSNVSYSRYNIISNNVNFNDKIIRSYEKRHQYYSAGVLPFSKDNDGNVLFLLGKDKEGNWSDFGGRSEHTDNGIQAKTASRELYEETMGSVMSLENGFKMLSLPNFLNRRTLITSKTLGGSPYYMYLLEIQYADYKKNFKRTFDFVRYSGNRFVEKTDIRWVSLETLIGATDSDLDNENVLVPLRPIFKQTLKNHMEEIKNNVSLLL